MQLKVASKSKVMYNIGHSSSCQNRQYGEDTIDTCVQYGKVRLLEIRQLRYFMQVCESGSLLKASEVLFISHQALSKSLSLLEKELGAALFYRTPKGMIPTQFGQELLEDSRPILAEWDQLNLKLEESATRHKGKIRLGLSGGLIYFGSKRSGNILKSCTRIRKLNRMSTAISRA